MAASGERKHQSDRYERDGGTTTTTYDELNLPHEMLLAGLRRDKFEENQVNYVGSSLSESVATCLQRLLDEHGVDLLEHCFTTIAINRRKYDIQSGKIINEPEEEEDEDDDFSDKEYVWTETAISEIRDAIKAIKLVDGVSLSVKSKTKTETSYRGPDRETEYIIIKISLEGFGSKKIMEIEADHYNDGDLRGPAHYTYSYDLDEILTDLKNILEERYSKYYLGDD